jgi:hypothetical protein
MNPAARRRGKGRKGQRRIERIEKARKVWASPLDAHLIAERTAALTGSSADFVFLVTIAYTGRYVFLGPRGGHFRRSNYSERVMRPASDGWHPARRGSSPRAAMPVLIDAGGRFPGRPLPVTSPGRWCPLRRPGAVIAIAGACLCALVIAGLAVAATGRTHRGRA